MDGPPADVYKPFAKTWDSTLEGRLEHWSETCSLYFRNPCVCAFCGIFKLGSRADDTADCFTQVAPLGAAPPYAYANAFLARFTVTPAGDWNCCSSCRSVRKPNAAYAVFMSPSYQRALLDCTPLQQQFLSVLDCRVDIAKRYHGFAHGQYTSDSLLEHPLIAWNDAAERVENRIFLTSALEPVLQVLLQHNSVVQRYLTALEVPSMEHGYPVLPSSSIASIISGPIARSPIQSMYTDPMPSLMSTVTAMNVTPALRRAATSVGTLRPRDHPTLSRPCVMQADGTADASGENCSLEQGLFPYLFPFNKGSWDGAMGICAYIHLRCQQLFSPFTMCRTYLLLMYHVRQAHVLATSCTSTMLQRDIDRYSTEHPHATEQQIMQNVLKHSVPGNVPGSPAWFRIELSKLLARVDAWGLPSFFLTLTADEHSPLRWTEIHDMEQLLKSFCNSYSFENVPVECSTHFLNRIQDFLREHILHDNGILGKCEHYVIRYEVQHRGSLHAHIVIWIQRTDVPRAASDISACIPAVFDEVAQEFIAPTDPQRLALFNLVTKKHMHTCIDNMCLGDNHRCKYGFPHAVQPCHAPVFQPTNNRWLYYRPRFRDRNVVPYHPVILLLWGAHMNLQRITQTAWSFYVLKYAMKAEPAGRLVVDPEGMSQLGLQRMDAVHLRTASALILSKPVSPAEAAMICLEQRVVQSSSPVDYLASQPPDLRKRRVLHCPQVVAAPVDHYMARPTAVEHLTFTQYFQQHKVNRKHSMPDALSLGVDLFGFHVWHMNEPFIVCFTDYHPVYQTEAFFYNLLLQKTVFRSENALLSSANKSKTYFEQCHLNDLVKTMDDIDTLLKDYAKRHLQDSEQRERLKTLLLQKNGCMEDILGSPNSADEPSHLDFPQASSAADPARFPFADISGVELNVDQRGFVDQMLVGAHGLHFLTGGPRSGKTFTIKYLLQSFANENVPFIACATTGAAATRIGFGATTMHDAFGIPPKNAYLRPLPLESPVYANLRAAKVIVLDEVSMLSPQTWDFVMYRLLDAFGLMTDMQALLQQVLFILVGDHAQLPAICRHRMPNDQVCTACQMYSSFWWDHVNMHELEIPMRHTDPEFAELIRVMRKERPTQEHLDSVLEQCIIPPAEVTELMQDNDLLCAYRREVSQYKEAALLAKFTTPLIHAAHPAGSAAKCPELSEWFNDPQANPLPLVAIGAKVMVLSNINVAASVANGSSGIVDSLKYDRHGKLVTIVVKMTDSGRLQRVTRSQSHSRTYEGKTYYRTTFPLTLAYAMTVHKSQGATMDFVLVDISDAFSSGLLYVALSRVRTRQHLRLLHRPLASACTPVPFPRMPDPSKRQHHCPALHQPVASSPLQSDLMPSAGICIVVLRPCAAHAPSSVQV